jgi:hypothetical protein
VALQMSLPPAAPAPVLPPIIAQPSSIASLESAAALPSGDEKKTWI